MTKRFFKEVSPSDDRQAWLMYAKETRHRYIASGGDEVPVFRFALPQDRFLPAPHTTGAVPERDPIEFGELTLRAVQVELDRNERETLCRVRVKGDDFYFGTKSGRFYEAEIVPD